MEKPKQMQNVFLEYFHAFIAAVDRLDLHWVSDYSLKTQNKWYSNDLIIHTATALPWSYGFGVGCRDSSLLIHCLFALNIVRKYPFFITCDDFQRKRIMFAVKKKTCHYGYAIFLILTYSLFLSCFKWREILNWDALMLNTNFWVLLHGFQSTNSLQASWSRSEEHSSLDSSFKDVSPELNY